MNYVHTTSVMLLALGAPGYAMAQDRPPPALEEILVTAQKRPETLREVPMSVATLSGDESEAIFSGGEDILALAARVPSLYAESSNGRAAPRFYIRGLGNSDFDLAASQPVSIIFDDVVQENVVLKSFPIFDVGQIEVVRGPQGTLFGRNTTAGVVKIDSKKPTADSEGYLKLSGGNLGMVNFEGGMGGSLVDDVLMARVSVLSQNRDDWIDNTYTQEQDAMGGLKDFAGRFQLLFSPTDDLDILLNLHTRDLTGTATLFRANALKPGVKAELVDDFERDQVYYDKGDNNPQEYKNSGASLQIDWDVGNITIESISAYEGAEGRSKGDIDGGVAGDGPGFIPFDAVTEDTADVEQITQELRFASNYDAQLQWQTGLYYFDSSLDVTTIDGFFGATSVTHENMSYAIFGQISYEFNSKLTSTFGIRYTYDEKSLVVGEQNVDSFALSIGEAAIQDYPDTDIDDSQVSVEASLNYFITPNSSLFGRLAQGFRAQSIQGRDIAFEGNPSVADSEIISSAELGYKADLLSNSLRLNTAIYYYEIDDLQLTAVGGSGNFNALLNADKGIGQGVEFDLTWLVNRYLELSLGGSYNDTEISDADLTTVACGSGQCTVTDPSVTDGDGNVIASIDGNPFQSAPETLFNVGLKLILPLQNDADIYFYTDWAYQGETHLALYEALEYEVADQYEGGVRLGYISHRDNYEIGLFSRNVSDEENIKGQIDFNNLTAFVNDPRVVGIDFTMQF